jgi:hypothetical protein
MCYHSTAHDNHSDPEANNLDCTISSPCYDPDTGKTINRIYCVETTKESELTVLTKERDQLKAERDRYREALENAQEHFSDAWALSVDYDGFGYDGKSLRGLIDDIVLNMGLGRKIIHTALKEGQDGG